MGVAVGVAVSVVTMVQLSVTLSFLGKKTGSLQFPSRWELLRRTCESNGWSQVGGVNSMHMVTGSSGWSQVGGVSSCR